MPASSLLKLMFLKKEWALTPAAPSAWQPSLCLGSLVSSCAGESPRYPSARPPPSATRRTDVPVGTHHSADGLGVLGELVVVLFLLLLHAPLHLLPLHPLLAGAEGGSPGGHLVHEAAQPPQVGAHAVLLVVDHLWGWSRCQGSLVGVQQFERDTAVKKVEVTE